MQAVLRHELASTSPLWQKMLLPANLDWFNVYKALRLSNYTDHTLTIMVGAYAYASSARANCTSPRENHRAWILGAGTATRWGLPGNTQYQDVFPIIHFLQFFHTIFKCQSLSTHTRETCVTCREIRKVSGVFESALWPFCIHIVLWIYVACPRHKHVTMTKDSPFPSIHNLLSFWQAQSGGRVCFCFKMTWCDEQQHFKWIASTAVLQRVAVREN